MLRRSISIVVAAVLISVPSSAAQPRQGVPVAGPTPSGARLFVFDDGDSICGTVRGPGQRFRSQTCGGVFPSFETPVINFDDHGPGRLAFLWGAVAAEVTAVEVVFTDGRRVRTDTSDGAAYRGRHAGEVRFFLMETRKRRAGPLYVRLLDQAGQLLSAEEVDPDSGEPRGPVVVVDRGRLGAERWRLTAFRRLRLIPLPGDEERVVGESCVAFDYSGTGRFRGPSLSSQACADPDGFLGPWALSVDTACRAIGLSATGIAPPGARRLVAVLGDGRRLRVPLRGLPARFGAQRAFALVLGPRTALRRLVAFEEGRRRNLTGAIAPGTTNCPNSTTSILVGFPGLDLFDEPRFGPEGPALQVRDDGALLCATIGLPGPLDCMRPPLEAEESRVMWHATDAGTFTAGVLSSQVATVVLEWDGGERQHIPTTTEGPYTGRYQGLLRFFTASLPGRRSLRRVELLDAGGRRLYATRVFELPVFDPAPVAVLRGSGGWRLGVGLLRFRGRRALCLQLSRGAFSREPLGCVGSQTRIEVRCRPRGMRFYGRLRDGVRVARVETDRGVFDARTARLPRRLGVAGGVFLIELPANARPRALVFEGRRTDRRRRIRLPAAASQCGYGTSLY